MKIAVGMSGGVDSSVAVYLLQQEGHDVIGAIMKIWDASYPTSMKGNSCFGPDEAEDIEDAQKVCLHLDIPLHIIDCTKQYKDIVLGYFNNEYTAGRTPNPCVLCNKTIKFDLLPSLLADSGVEFDRFATGHYSRITFDEPTQRYLLKKAVDQRKDQTYFLYRLSQEQLSKTLFPIGELTKEKVRQIASDAGLPVHNKRESQDFYSGNYADLITSKDNTVGNIVDTNGKVLGRHKGLWNYTVGQRKGLGVFHKNPLYVISINKDENEIVIGEKEHLFSKGLTADNTNMIVKETPQKAHAKIRSNSKEVPCTISYKKNELKVIFDEPQSAVTPGQSVVLYSDDIVLGGGIIEKAITI